MSITPGTALEDAHAALYGVVSTDAPTLALVTGVFGGDAPTSQSYPYITFGNKSEVPFRSFGKLADKDIEFIIHIWSMSENDEESLAILKVLNEALDGKTLTGALFKHTVLLRQAAPQYDSEIGVYNTPVFYRVVSTV